jgi:glycosyltransferase involved in cell wall biosynthesis
MKTTGKVSILIPARNERFLQKTLDDLLAKAAGDIEIIVTLDGPPFENQFPTVDPRVRIVYNETPVGMRAAINQAAACASGEFLLKIDGHCMVGPGYDEILKAEMLEPDWVAIPRRYSLEPETWTFLPNGKPPVDYHYLCYPFIKPHEVGLHGNVWTQRAKERQDILIDDEMSSQGSCWFLRARHFVAMSLMDETGYGAFVQEAQEICNKTWLSGGRVIINKKTWYAHLHKGKTYGRGYFISKPKMIRGAQWSADLWMNNAWPGQVRTIEWLVEHFWPVPTWPQDPASWIRNTVDFVR